MLRAATTGGFDYRGADPYDNMWRVRHTLVMRDMRNLNAAQVLQFTHEHWLAYVSHSRLEEDSWRAVKNQAQKALQALQTAVIPWYTPEENEEQKDTIDMKYGNLIAQYKAMVAEKQAQKKETEDTPQQ